MTDNDYGVIEVIFEAPHRGKMLRVTRRRRASTVFIDIRWWVGGKPTQGAWVPDNLVDPLLHDLVPWVAENIGFETDE